MRTILIVLVWTVSVVTVVVVGSPKSARSVAESRTPSKFKRFFEILGRNGDKQEQQQQQLQERQFPFQQQFVPCAITTTTTPLPFVGPMCPIYPPQQQQQQLGGQFLPQPLTGGGQYLPQPSALVRPPQFPLPPQPQPNLVTGGTGIGTGGNVNVIGLPERPPQPLVGQFGGPFLPPPPQPELPSIEGGTGIGIGGNVNVPLPPERPYGGVEIGLRPFVPSRPQQNIVGGLGIGEGGNVNIPPPPPERPSGILIGLGPFRPPLRPDQQPVNLVGGTGIGQGGNVNIPDRPERPGGGYFVGGPPEPYPRPGVSATGGTGIGQGGNVNAPLMPERPIGMGQFPLRPEQPISVSGGTGIGQGGNVNVPLQPERPMGGYYVGGGGGPEPYPRPGVSVTGGTGIGQGGNVNVPLTPERPIGMGQFPLRPEQPISVSGGTGIGQGGNVNVPLMPERPIGMGQFPLRPEQPTSISGGAGIGQGGDVVFPGGNGGYRPEPIPSPSELRPVPVQPPPFGGGVRNPVCPVGEDDQFPYTPPGFFFANPYLIPPPPQDQRQCPLYPRPDLPPCSTMEVLDRLQLRTMSRYIVKAGLEQLFTMTNNYTFFVPADPAFHTLPDWFLASLENDVKLLRAFVLNHFIKVDIPLQNFGNDYLILNARPGANRLRSNVYFPELPYRTYTIDGSKVLLGDILTRTGRLNIVNKVVVPSPPRNAVQYLQEVPEFSKFMSAVVAANMVDVLQGPDPITFFIPYNDAFNFFDLNVILRNATALRNFVNYHIVPGTHYSNGLLSGQYLTTLFDKEIRLSVSSDGFTKTLNVVNNVNRVLKADIPLLNGVAHVLGGVMSNIQEFYFYQQMNEFHTLNFGTLKRSDNQVKDEAPSR